MRITMGVTGGVAAYKAAELVRLLQQDGFTVEVVMTRGGAGIYYAADLCGFERAKSNYRPVWQF